MTSLYFLGKYDIMLDIVLLFFYSIGLFHRLTILPVSPIYTCPQEQNILYTLVELSGGLWSLGYLQICLIFFAWFKDNSDIVFVYPANPICCSFDMRKWIGSFHLIFCQRPLSCLHVYWLFWLCLFCPFFWKVNFKWLNSVDVLC